MRQVLTYPDRRIYISSSTPTLSSVIKARSGLIPRPIVPNLLMGQPGIDIPRVEEELRRIQKFGNFVHVLVGEEASHGAVISAFDNTPGLTSLTMAISTLNRLVHHFITTNASP
jgi:hypothetical protein